MNDSVHAGRINSSSTAAATPSGRCARRCACTPSRLAWNLGGSRWLIHFEGLVNELPQLLLRLLLLLNLLQRGDLRRCKDSLSLAHGAGRDGNGPTTPAIESKPRSAAESSRDHPTDITTAAAESERGRRAAATARRRRSRLRWT